MWSVSLAICSKDLRLLVSRGSALVQGVLLGLLVIFIFSLAQGVGEQLSPQSAATIFWISSLFCQVLLFNQIYALEEQNQARVALVLLPVPALAIWLAKTLCTLILLLFAQLFFLPALCIFLGQSPSGSLGVGLLGIVFVDLGTCSLGSLLGALAQGQVSRESLVSILLFPLISPILLAGIGIHTETLGGGGSDPSTWLFLTLAYDAIFFAVSCFLFPFIYTGEDA